MSARSLRARTSCQCTECSPVIGQNSTIKTTICTLTGTEGTNAQTNAVYSVLGWRGPFMYNSGKSFILLFAPSINVVG